MTEGQASISADIVARYAGDAALDVAGVRGLSGRRGVRIGHDDDGLHVEIHVVVDWGTAIPEVGRSVQHQVVEYLRRMADVAPASVQVIFDEIGPPP